jgi:hypothetical protein
MVMFPTAFRNSRATNEDMSKTSNPNSACNTASYSKGPAEYYTELKENIFEIKTVIVSFIFTHPLLVL